MEARSLVSNYGHRSRSGIFLWGLERRIKQGFDKDGINSQNWESIIAINVGLLSNEPYGLFTTYCGYSFVLVYGTYYLNITPVRFSIVHGVIHLQNKWKCGNSAVHEERQKCYLFYLHFRTTTSRTLESIRREDWFCHPINLDGLWRKGDHISFSLTSCETWFSVFTWSDTGCWPLSKRLIDFGNYL